MKRGLQIVLGVLSLIPLTFAILGMALGPAYFMGAEAYPAALDNQYRYLSAIYIAFTFLIWWMIPNIERHATPVRILTGVFFLGGLARLYSHLTIGPGDPEQFVGMILELAAPLIAVWQGAVVRRAT